MSPKHSTIARFPPLQWPSDFRREHPCTGFAVKHSLTVHGACSICTEMSRSGVGIGSSKAVPGAACTGVDAGPWELTCVGRRSSSCDRLTFAFSTEASAWPEVRCLFTQVRSAKPLATAGRTLERSAGTCRAESTAERRPPTPPSNQRPGDRTGNYPLSVRVTALAITCRWTLSSPWSSRKLVQSSAPRASRREDAQDRNSRGCLLSTSLPPQMPGEQTS